MIPFMYGRSKTGDNDEPSSSGGTGPSGGCRDILLIPYNLILILIYGLYRLITGIWNIGRWTGKEAYQVFRKAKLSHLALIFAVILAGDLLILALPKPPYHPNTRLPSIALPERGSGRTVTILVDDFRPRPYQGTSTYFYNRLEGDRGAINNSVLDWEDGKVKMSVAAGTSWGGAWTSLNHPIRENLPINFSAVLPAQILPAYQSRITGLSVEIEAGTQGRRFRVELKDGNELRWKDEITLNGGQQVMHSDLPALGNIHQLVWVLDPASPGDSVVLKSIALTTSTPIKDTAMEAFVWSYGMLLNNWNADTGLVRDKAKDASGEFDAIQSTGSLAAATAAAKQLGVVDEGDAEKIIEKISQVLLEKLPRFHGLWPHWVTVSSSGEIAILKDTEWSSVDTVIAAIALLDAQNALKMDTAATEQFLRAIDWKGLRTAKGISHGYTFSGELIPYAWDTFGGESWLVELAYAGANGERQPIAYPTPPTANGSGFIDELAWLFLPPPQRPDAWGTDWGAYRSTSANNQITYFARNDPDSCNTLLGLFGLSAGEVPDPSRVPQPGIYQAYGIGGAFAAVPLDGSDVFAAPVVTPHYSAMAASLRPREAIKMWQWLIDSGHFSPLNNVESLALPKNTGCDPDAMLWNQLKGSWNLALQTLGWGNYLAARNGETPILWQAASENALLKRGYLLLVPGQAVVTPHFFTLADWTYTRECEDPNAATVGQSISRSNASGLAVHGQFGSDSTDPWAAKPGEVIYKNIQIPAAGKLLLKLRYSKDSPLTTPIWVYLDEDSTPRARIALADQKSWNQFAWTGPISLGGVSAGTHSLKLSTLGQQYGVADLDAFTLTAAPADPTEVPPTPRYHPCCR